MELEQRFTEQDIDDAVARLGRELGKDFEGQNPILIGILKGSFIFLADLARKMGTPCEIDFVRASSYGANQESSGTIEISLLPSASLAGRHVIVVEDILDTGLTLDAVMDRLRSQGPASLRSCVLVAREGSSHPDYLGLWTGPGFLVGYGLDSNEAYRWLPDIRVAPPPHV